MDLPPGTATIGAPDNTFQNGSFLDALGGSQFVGTKLEGPTADLAATAIFSALTLRIPKCPVAPWYEGAAEGTGATTWQQYERAIQNVYGGPASFSGRQYQAVVNGELVNGVADNVATIGGNSVAVEAKFVNNWATSIRNPASPVGGMPFAVEAQQQMLSQAQAYSAAFDQVIYHSNSPELIQYYSSVFNNASIKNFQFILTK